MPRSSDPASTSTTYQRSKSNTAPSSLPRARGEDNSGGADDEESIAERRIRCLTRGVYLGSQNQYVNCVDYCRVSSEEEVRYVYLATTEKIIAGRSPLAPGAWCLPTSAASCNLNSAIVVYSLNGWLCLPKTDILVGEGGNKIAVCNGSLWDNALQVQYDGFIPANLFFNDIYEDRLSDGRYRFQCLANLKDDLQNLYLRSPFNRFHLVLELVAYRISLSRRIRARPTSPPASAPATHLTASCPRPSAPRARWGLTNRRSPSICASNLVSACGITCLF